MIFVKYRGRLGNNIFQYNIGRLLAHLNSTVLKTTWIHPEFINMTPVESPAIIEDSLPTITKRNFIQEDFTPGRFSGKNVRCAGHVQYHRVMTDNKELVKSWMNMDPILPGHEKDIVLHMRLGDYFRFRKVIHPSWYRNILEKDFLKGRKIYGVVEKPRTKIEQEYVDKIRDLIPGIIIEYRSAREDFNFIRQFGIIICSNSTFCWWAAFLSEAKKVFVYSPWFTSRFDLDNTRGWVKVKGKYYSKTAKIFPRSAENI